MASRRERALWSTSTLVLGIVAMPSSAHASDCGEGEMWVVSSAVMNNNGVGSEQSGYCVPVAGPQEGPKEPNNEAPSSDEPQPVKATPYDYAYAFACAAIDQGSLVPGSVSGEPCATAALACEFQGSAAGAQRLNIYRRLKVGGAWVFAGTSCGPSDTPAGVPQPPPIPTLAQIQQAFLSLPFAKPTVNIQPEGDVTLVNLPTYFEAQWPTDKLGPGDISKPVQLLSWSIEFRIDPAEYTYSYGDGTASEPTTDRGGPHPEGRIRHTYRQPNPAAPVKVDARLTGSYRVNGGANWIPLGGVADLQDEPVVTLEVREAKARLYGNAPPPRN